MPEKHALKTCIELSSLAKSVLTLIRKGYDLPKCYVLKATSTL